MKKNKLKTLIILLFVLATAQMANAQRKALRLNHGDGWYRIISSIEPRAGGQVTIEGALGNNRFTLINMQVSLMRFSQGGSINITDNLHYNRNHVREIRGGSQNSQRIILDVYFENIVGTPTVFVNSVGTGLNIVSEAEFSPAEPTGNVVSIAGDVIGISSKSWPLYFNSRVGIGTDSPTNELEVNGTIRAQELICEANPWPDYVFKSDYKLKSLEEVEARIKENGHLPNIPSAQEVAEKGIKVAEMNAKLLEKIEELTLYMIEQNKRMNEMETELNAMKQKGVSGK